MPLALPSSMLPDDVQAEVRRAVVERVARALRADEVVADRVRLVLPFEVPARMNGSWLIDQPIDSPTGSWRVPAVDDVVDPVERAAHAARLGQLAARARVARLVERPQAVVNRRLVRREQRARRVVVDAAGPTTTIDHCRVRLCGPMPSSPGIDSVSSVPNDTEHVIDDDGFGRRRDRHRVVAIGRRADAAAHAQEADDDVAPADRELAAADADAAARRGLTGDGDVRVA